MKATDLIEKQHREVEALFERFEKASDGDKPALFEAIAANLVAHDAIEREILYPAYERANGEADDTLREALVEHGLVEFSLFRASKNSGKESFDSFVKALKEVVKHHVEEEEEQFIPKAEKKLGASNEALGAKMEARFEEAKAKDFKKPLRDAVDQLLTGRAKIDTRGKKKTAAAAPKRARTAASKKRAGKPRKRAASTTTRARARRR